MSVAHEPVLPRTLTNAEKGVILAVMAHLVWGGMAIYFGLIRHISPVEIAVNRGLWSLPIAGLVVTYLGQWGEVWRAVTPVCKHQGFAGAWRGAPARDNATNQCA